MSLPLNQLDYNHTQIVTSIDLVQTKINNYERILFQKL